MLERTSSRELTEYSLLFALKSEEADRDAIEDGREDPFEAVIRSEPGDDLDEDDGDDDETEDDETEDDGG